MTRDDSKKDTNEPQTEYLLDMVFVLDCTGSMASYINSARDNIVKISKELSKLSQGKENGAKPKDKNESQKENKDNKNNDPAEPEGQVEVEGVPDTAAPKKNDKDNKDDKNNKNIKTIMKRKRIKQKKKRVKRIMRMILCQKNYHVNLL